MLIWLLRHNFKYSIDHTKVYSLSKREKPQVLSSLTYWGHSSWYCTFKFNILVDYQPLPTIPTSKLERAWFKKWRPLLCNSLKRPSESMNCPSDPMNGSYPILIFYPSPRFWATHFDTTSKDLRQLFHIFEMCSIY